MFKLFMPLNSSEILEINIEMNNTYLVNQVSKVNRF